jgi:hypothetical protein
MPIVTNPPDGANKSNNTWVWDMEGVFYLASKVINGTQAGGSNIYPGSPKLNPIVTDNAVVHPHDNGIYSTRVKYRKVAGTTFPYGGDPSSFKSV